MDFTPLIIPAFIAGIFTFLAPCTLPLVPGYLAFISGVSASDLKNPQKASTVRGKVFLNGLFYVIGFSAVFILIGTLLGLGGAALAGYRVLLTRIGGAVIIILGLHMAGLWHPRFLQFLSGEKKIHAGTSLKSGRPLSSLAFGAIFALGWTPCVGPILGVILTFAASSGTVLKGTILLTVFSLGLALPFLAIALGMESASRNIAAFFSFLKRFRVPILFVFGLALGFTLNLALLAIGSLMIGAGVTSGGENLVTLASLLLDNYLLLLPLVVGVLISVFAYHKEDTDPLSLGGGLFLVLLGIILLANGFGLVVEYSYKVFGFINYNALLNLL